MKYFYKNASGLNADIERHRIKEAELTKKILELEGKADDMSQAVLRSYRSALNVLMQSKADVVSKIGKSG
jgi:hypothetical protein